jgi:uncharacterized protein (TIGR03067 family)
MRRLSLLLAVLFVLLLFGSDAPKEYDDKTTVDPLEGSWRLIEWENFGEKTKSEDQCVWTFQGRTYVSKSINKKVRGSYHIDLAHNPPHLDRTSLEESSKGQTRKCIYQIDGDTLRIAVSPSWQRPQGFNDDGVYIFTYKRVK